MNESLASLFPLAVFAVAIAAIAVTYLFAQRTKRRQIEQARALAAKYGFEVDVTTKPPPELRFDLFDRGHSKKVSFQFWRPGEHDSVFDYQYTTGSGKNSQTFRHTCALVALPFAAPHTKIGPEGFWSKIGQRLGIRDIEVESPTFNQRYRVNSDDERFAITMLDGQAIDWFLSANSVARFELWGTWMLCIVDRLDREQVFGYHDWAIGIPAHLPEVLTSLYPPAGVTR
ncbi:MAG: hypothetical protein ACE37B_17645 [Ilumatobacter sp.]|uniref:hypothetical protein n=1 Tax=Ilumatobacter sp. TaxID=1967498 RepID=UPI00391AEC9B